MDKKRFLIKIISNKNSNKQIEVEALFDENGLRLFLDDEHLEEIINEAEEDEQGTWVLPNYEAVKNKPLQGHENVVHPIIYGKFQLQSENEKIDYLIRNSVYILTMHERNMTYAIENYHISQDVWGNDLSGVSFIKQK